jgi:hypothetical protein
MDPNYLWATLQQVSSLLYRETGDVCLLGLQDVAMAIRFDDPERFRRGLVTLFGTRTNGGSSFEPPRDTETR